MAITLVRNQLVDSIINENKLDNGAVAFAKLKSADVETDLASSASASKLATAAAIKAYVDAQVPDTFSGGDGIAIDSSGDPDVIAVDLAVNPGLQFTSGKLDVKVKSESGGSITKDAQTVLFLVRLLVQTLTVFQLVMVSRCQHTMVLLLCLILLLLLMVLLFLSQALV